MKEAWNTLWGERKEKDVAMNEVLIPGELEIE